MKPYSNRNANKRVAGYKRKRSLASADEVVRQKQMHFEGKESPSKKDRAKERISLPKISQHRQLPKSQLEIQKRKEILYDRQKEARSQIKDLPEYMHIQKSQALATSHTFTARPSVETPLTKLVSRRVMPKTKDSYGTTRRVQWNRRKSQKNCNVVVFLFEGVIGDIFKANFWENSPVSLYLRQGASRGLRRLLQKFQVVLFTRLSKIDSALTYFKTHGVEFDAVYQSNCEKSDLFEHSKYVQDYTQIVMDFEIQDKVLSNMIVISSLDVDNDDLRTRNVQLFDVDGSSSPQIMVKAIPINETAEPHPLVMLVTNPRAQPSLVGTSFLTIADLISQFSEVPSRDAPEAYPGLWGHSWFDCYYQVKTEGQLPLQLYETQFFHYEVLRKKKQVTEQDLENVVWKQGVYYPRLLLPQPPAIKDVVDHPTFVISKAQNTFTTRETGPSKSNTDLFSQRKKAIHEQCHCPEEFQKLCHLERYRYCRTVKQMCSYHVHGEQIPKSFLRNRLMILQTQAFPLHPYTRIDINASYERIVLHQLAKFNKIKPRAPIYK